MSLTKSRRRPAALLARTSTGPSASSTSSTARTHSRGSATSDATAQQESSRSATTGPHPARRDRPAPPPRESASLSPYASRSPRDEHGPSSKTRHHPDTPSKSLIPWRPTGREQAV